MRLLKLTFNYFKGLVYFVFEPNGNNADIYGDNGTYKTTIVDGEHWLLFGKDSLDRSIKSPGKAGFEIKTLDANGNALHNLEHEVEGVYEIQEGKITTLRRVYKETWVKKRGQPKPEHTGHTTDYFIDGVPKSEKDYNAFISSILNENVFKLLTNPLYFSERLKWEDRRRVLVEIGGNVEDADVIKANKALKDLPAILQGRSVEDHKKVIAARKTKINDELKNIPIRINEVRRSLPDITGIASEKLEIEIADIQSKIQGKEQEIARIESGGEVAEKTKRLREIEGELLQLKNQHREMVDEKLDGRRKDLSAAKTLLHDQESECARLEKLHIQAHNDRKDLKDKRAKLAEEWKQKNAQEFVYEQDSTCPACGQALPTERLQAAREKALEQFNQSKSESLERINKEGSQIKDQISTLSAKLEELSGQIDEANQNLKVTENHIEDIKIDIESLTENMGAPEDMPEYSGKLTEKNAMQQEITDLQASTQDTLSQAHKKLDQLSEDLLTRQTSKVKIEQSITGQERIAELEKQETELAAEYERLEKELHLIELFTKTQVSLVENKINGKFKMARFKLFDVQVNGAVVPCCETLYNGVPFSSGLNTGHRNAVGMDIINTLSEHFNFYPPVFVDNAESITVLPPMKAQVIRLIVSEPDKTLRVEIVRKEEGVLFG